MPPARSASAAPRHQRQARTPAGPRRVAGKPAVARVRWDRVGRVSLLVVLAVVAGLYAQHALSYLSTRAEANREAANVQRLSRENAALTRQQRSLNDPATITRDARALGMVKAGERPYVITGLPSN
jgi:cell division protein FtsB